MLGVDLNSVTKPFSDGLASLRAARVFVRRVGPNFFVNVVVTKIQVEPGGERQVTTRVSVGEGEPIREVTTSSEDSQPEAIPGPNDPGSALAGRPPAEKAATPRRRPAKKAGANGGTAPHKAPAAKKNGHHHKKH